MHVSVRNAITRSQLILHRYRVETGRRVNRILRGEIVCETCNVIKFKYHVLITCPRFINERRERLPEYMLV